MSWRAPWLRERYFLLLLAFLDLFIVLVVYSLTYVWKIGQLPGLTTASIILVIFWLGGSYLIGRYTQQRRGISSLSRTFFLALFILSLFVTQAWLIGITDSGTRLRSFLLPLLGLIAFSSWLGHDSLIAIRGKREAFVLICTEFEKSVIKQDLEGFSFDLQSKITLMDEFEDPSTIFKSPLRGLNVAVSDQACIPDRNLEHLVSLRPLGVRVGSLVDWTERIMQRVPPELLSDRWLLAADGFTLQPGRWSWRVKRFFDVLGALSLLFISFPVICLGSLSIWIEDRGPIFYSQIRSGLYGKPFRVWKLRSMRVDAESSGIQWAQKHDLRITRSGALLRQLRIDELPQLWGVVRGDLSLIGPRPERPELEIDLEKQIPHYRVRHWIRPGLSGWAQVNYPYGNSVADSRIKLSYDLYYLRNAGILLDMLILLKTIRLVLRREGFQPQT